jgi:hypothetical protein
MIVEEFPQDVRRPPCDPGGSSRFDPARSVPLPGGQAEKDSLCGEAIERLGGLLASDAQPTGDVRRLESRIARVRDPEAQGCVEVRCECLESGFEIG